MRRIQEGSCTLELESSADDKISKKLPVFYNPVMRLNRDLSLLVLEASTLTQIRMADPFAGSGVRAMRMLKELSPDIIGSVTLGDNNPVAIASIKRNMLLNGLEQDHRIQVVTQDANQLFQQSKGFQYIDLDPFGTPNPYLDQAIAHLGKEGILAVTATDTAALSGSALKVTRRHYWADNKKGPAQHERGLRILIRKVQLIGVQYDRALIPVLSYFKDHYYRVFFRCSLSKKNADQVYRSFGLLDKQGPLYCGPLFDGVLMQRIKKSTLLEKMNKDTVSFVNTLVEESSVDVMGYVDLHELSSVMKRNALSKERVIVRLQQEGFKVASSHISPTAIRTTATQEDIVRLCYDLK